MQTFQKTVIKKRLDNDKKDELLTICRQLKIQAPDGNIKITRYRLQ